MITFADWEATVKFHGHICPGVAVGHRACWYARKLLNLTSPSLAPEYVVVAENDLCGLDAVQVNTGCTVGNDGLIINLQGKQAFSFINKKTGLGVRIVLEAPLWDSNHPIELPHKVKLGTATPEEAQEFFRLRLQRGEQLLELTDEELFKV
ncbi:MAG: FmdE family protein, partial [Syntrophomonadaceae bacterium]